MLSILTEEELEFMESFYDPICLAECLFGNFDNLGTFFPDKRSHIRLAQLSFLSYEYLIDDNNPDYTEKENFKLREKAGTLYVFGGRKFGKTLFVETIDILISMLLCDGENAGFTSLDAIHIRGILDLIVRALESHAFYQRVMSPKITRSPNYSIFLNNGYHLVSVNMNLHSRNPGDAFFQKHFKRLYIEEASFESDVVFNKRQDSVSEDGCIIRSAGMSNFTKFSPAGRVFFDASEKPRVINLPQYVNPKWSEKEKKSALKKYSGENSLGYRIYVKGEVVEEGISALDMERVKLNYDEDKKIKHYEVNKKNLNNIKNILFVERPRNAERLYLCADIGETAPSEIIILSEVNKKFRYLYNITLYNLTDKEQEIVFSYLITLLKADIIALDTTEGLGRALFRSLELKHNDKIFIWVGFNEKIAVEFERNDSGKIIFKNGEMSFKFEYVVEWAFLRLREMLYNESISIPLDFKLDTQLNSVIAIHGTNRITYPCVAEEDHLYAAFLVFSIAQWNIEFNLVRTKNAKRFSKSGC